MFKAGPLFVVVLAGATIGCGGKPEELPVARPAHAGMMIALPGAQGFVEVLVDSAAATGTPKGQARTRIVAYFTQSDGTTALSPGPTDVKVKIGMGESGRVVDLASDAKEPGKYASESGDYPDGFAGQLEASVNGQAVTVPVIIR